MKTLKGIFMLIIITPNMPIMILWCLVMFYDKSINPDIWAPQDDNQDHNFLDEEMKGNIKKTFPKWFMCITSFIFYTWFTFNFIV